MNLFRAISRLLFFFVTVLPAAGLQAVFLLLAPVLSRKPASKFPYYYYRFINPIIGVDVEVVGGPPDATPALWVSNHTSWLDVFVLGSLAPVSFIAKSEVADWPIFGPLAKVTRTLFIERDRKSRTNAQVRQIAKRLNAGDILVLFPEGTSSDGTNVLPFKSTLFSSVDPGADSKIQPVAVKYLKWDGEEIDVAKPSPIAWYGDMALFPHLIKVLGGSRTKVKVTFCATVSIDKGSDRKAIANLCERAIRSAYETTE